MSQKSTQSKIQNIPKLRFPGFSGGWEEKKMGNIAEITSSKRVYSSDYVDIGVPFFRGKEISELKRSKTASDILYIKESKFLEFKNKFGVPQKGDILITSVGTLGNIYKVDLDYDFYFKDGNLIWLKNPKVDSSFLEMAIDFNKRNLLKGVIGSTQKALTIDGIKKVEINFPNIPEQQKIAEFLESVDEWISNLKEQKENIESYKKGMMQKIFSQEIRFKDENGKDFTNWSEKNFGEILEFLSDYTANGSFGSLKENVKYYSDNNFAALVRTTDLEKKVFKPERFTDEQGYNFLKKTSLFGGELIMSNVGNIGKIYKAPYYSAPMTLAPNTYLIRFNKNTCQDFMYQLMLDKTFAKKIKSVVGGGGLTAINKTNFRSISLSVPSELEEQQKMADFLTSIDKVIESKLQQIIEAEQWKKGIMQGLFV